MLIKFQQEKSLVLTEDTCLIVKWLVSTTFLLSLHGLYTLLGFSACGHT